MALTTKRKAAALEDATLVRNGHKWPSSHRGVKEEAKKIPDEIYDTADIPFRVECPVQPNKRKSKAVVDVFGPEYEDAASSPCLAAVPLSVQHRLYTKSLNKHRLSG